jgi:hypothetical protein
VKALCKVRDIEGSVLILTRKRKQKASREGSSPDAKSIRG